jgi:hypothetical protein
LINIEVKKSNKCNGEYSLYITFPYDQNIVNIMREQVIRYWLPDTKKWELPLKSFDNLKKQLKDYQLNIVDLNEKLSNFNFNR